MELVARKIFYMPIAFDPAFGTIWQPGAEVRHNLEGNGISHWKPLGVRASPLEQTGKAFPILVLGDSFTESLQIADDKVYTARVEALLAAEGVKVQVLNCGRAGNSVADYISKAALYQETFHPSWVVVQVQASDFCKDAWSESKSRNKANQKAYFAFDAEGHLQLKSPEIRPPETWGRMELLIYRVSNSFALLRFAFFRISEAISWFRNEAPLFRGSKPDKNVPQKPERYPIREEFELLKHAFDGRLTILLLDSFDPQAGSSQSETDRTIANLALEQGVGFVKLSDATAPLIGSGLSPYGNGLDAYGIGHMNQLGHRLVSELLAPEILKQLPRYGIH